MNILICFHISPRLFYPLVNVHRDTTNRILLNRTNLQPKPYAYCIPFRREFSFLDCYILIPSVSLSCIFVMLHYYGIVLSFRLPDGLPWLFSL